MKLSFVFLFLVAFCKRSNAGRILIIHPTDISSHFTLAERMAKEMLSSGHEVHLISPIELKSSTNFTHCSPGKDSKVLSKMKLLDLAKVTFWQEQQVVISSGLYATDFVMRDPCIQNLIKDPNEHFDLIMFEMFYTEVLYGLCHRFDAPAIPLSTIGPSIWSNHLVGNPAPMSYVPHFQCLNDGKMTIWEKIRNLYMNLMLEILRKYSYFPEADFIMHKYIPDAPSIYDLMYNRTALVFANTNPITSEARPHVPAMVEIGGFHLESPKPLPQTLHKIMDEAEYGVILFSMGSALNTKDFSNATKMMLMNTFSRLQQTVIWKGEQFIEGSLGNVVFMKWCPQNDILAHPNLKLFITHGGLLSLTEAVTRGVPVLSLPVFADQPMNAAIATRKGYGLSIPLIELTEQLFHSAIKEMITNPKYKTVAQSLSKIVLNQPMKPIDKAMFYVNEVIENRGAEHLRSCAMDLEWYQIYLLDVYSILIFTLLVSLYIVCKTVKYIYSKVVIGRIKKKIL